MTRIGLHGALRDSLRLGLNDCKSRSSAFQRIWDNHQMQIEPFHKIRKHVRRFVPQGRASYGSASHGRVLIGVCLWGVYLTGVHLMGVHLMGLRASYEHASHGDTLHGDVPHRRASH